ncbi:Signal transduction histidine kinase [Paenibacillus sp. UNCCL117]|uniref:HAMP domain-containing sensor histidine kinase n=1 Tax=unclassified Paenibacillus TaxID=185978 RepID=UPI00087E9A7F|nr:MULTISPECIES: HAMP domain-containing sensor histidine kinase [unclassified Paenibacillus]SDD97976.1 Signal transduction histidine kinase [Paenibacillus sp. cl123]SFW56065.1 Signal transduction histidine kinase [Paenibacillus sp. UNCCL117]
MKTLYVRIVLTYVVIAMVSGVLALLLTNWYYLETLRSFSERRALHLASEIRTLYESLPGAELPAFLSRMGNMGFQIYAADGERHGEFYGAPFKDTALGEEVIRRVLQGEVYQGLLEERRLLMVNGYFENSVVNTVGLRVMWEGEAYALFIRPDMRQQVGEVRNMLAVLLGMTFVLSIVFMMICTRYIVKPVKRLTQATRALAGGNYSIQADTARQDELGELSRHFAYMAESLKRLDSMRQEFVANVSHEIQSPLTTIQGFAQAMRSGEATEEEGRRYLAFIEEESRRLSSLGKQLLTLAALDQEEGVRQAASFRLDEQIRQALILTEWQWTGKGLAVEPELDEVMISADAGLLLQVWLNLIANAIKFTPEGGTVRISLAAESEGAIVTVSDTGAGIAPGDLPHIFDRFYKADKIRSRGASTGSGLGLAISQRIVVLHGGTIQAGSEPGQGAVFTVRLPLRAKSGL